MTDAVKAVQRGFSVFPVEPYTKTPIRLYPDRPREDAPWTIRWSEHVTNDLNTVAQMWSWCPEANVGIAAKQSGLLIVDCDIPKKEYQLKDTDYAYLHDLIGPLVDGETVYDQVCQRMGGNWAEAEDTYQVATGSGGLHYYYWWPDGVQASQGSIVKGILDIRCNGGEKGGYVLGAGSETDKGSYVARNSKAVRRTPDWLVELCKEQPRPVKPSRPAYAQPRNSNFGGLVDSVRTAGEGNRNAALFWAVRAMVSDKATLEEIEDLLGPAAQDVGLSDSEIRDSIRSGIRAQQRKDGG
jgi:hypothetical protein